MELSIFNILLFRIFSRNTDTEGRGVVEYPDDYEQENSSIEKQVTSQDSPYELHLTAKVWPRLRMALFGRPKKNLDYDTFGLDNLTPEGKNLYQQKLVCIYRLGEITKFRKFMLKFGAFSGKMASCAAPSADPEREVNSVT